MEEQECSSPSTLHCTAVTSRWLRHRLTAQPLGACTAMWWPLALPCCRAVSALRLDLWWFGLCGFVSEARLHPGAHSELGEAARDVDALAADLQQVMNGMNASLVIFAQRMCADPIRGARRE